MNGFKIKSLKELNEIKSQIALVRMSGISLFYRGQSSDNYKLLPSLCRNSHKDLEGLEKSLITEFYERLIEKGLGGKIQLKIFGDKYKNEKVWSLLFQFQHLGLPTRLLDWTISIEAAIYFAVENDKHDSKDGQLWIFYCPIYYFYPDKRKCEYLNINPYTISNTYFINHPFLADLNQKKYTGEYRREKQFGRFSIQPTDNYRTPLEEQKEFNQYIKKILIDKDYKKDIRKELNNKGYNKDRFYLREKGIINDIIKNLKKNLN